jgi:hypothetical protein
VGGNLFSWLLAIQTGYGCRPGRTRVWYLITVLGFAVAYYLLGSTQGHVFQPDGALVFTVTSFHGRGFVLGSLEVEETVTKLAAAKAVIGPVHRDQLDRRDSFPRNRCSSAGDAGHPDRDDNWLFAGRCKLLPLLVNGGMALPPG